MNDINKNVNNDIRSSTIKVNNLKIKMLENQNKNDIINPDQDKNNYESLFITLNRSKIKFKMNDLNYKYQVGNKFLKHKFFKIRKAISQYNDKIKCVSKNYKCD